MNAQNRRHVLEADSTFDFLLFSIPVTTTIAITILTLIILVTIGVLDQGKRCIREIIKEKYPRMPLRLLVWYEARCTGQE